MVNQVIGWVLVVAYVATCFRYLEKGEVNKESKLVRKLGGVNNHCILRTNDTLSVHRSVIATFMNYHRG
jgi:hypothetical protein